ncbi:MAG TPA: EamA family transporter [Pseudonocardiaceae bacterium]
MIANPVPTVISPARGTALIVAASCCFGFAGPIARSAMDAGLSPQQVASARIALAAVILLVGTGLVRPGALRLRRRDLPVLLTYGVVGVAACQLLYFVAVSRLPVGVAMLLEYLSPVLVTLWVRFVRHTALPAAAWLGVTLASVGLVLVAQVWQGAALDLLGVLAGLATAACCAAYFLLGERGVATTDPVGVTTWGLVVGAVTMLTVCRPWTIPVRLLAAPARFGVVLLPVWLLLVVVAVVATVVAYLTSMAALRHLPSSVVSALSLLEPVVATVLAWAMLGQRLSPVQVVGGVILLGGALIVRLAPRPTIARSPWPEGHRETAVAVPEARVDPGRSGA